MEKVENDALKFMHGVEIRRTAASALNSNNTN